MSGENRENVYSQLANYTNKLLSHEITKTDFFRRIIVLFAEMNEAEQKEAEEFVSNNMVNDRLPSEHYNFIGTGFKRLL